MKSKYIFGLLLCLVVLILIPSVSGVAQLVWSIPASYCVTAIDTNYDASKIYVGTGNGCITAYNISGSMLWYNQTNASASSKAIKKIVATTDGTLVWSSTANQSGYINSDGTPITVKTTSTNISDIAITSDGSKWAITEKYPPKVKIYDSAGNLYVSNESISMKNWTRVALDPISGNWLVTANQSSHTLYFWNTTSWVGWEDFNPLHTAAKNASQSYIDSFPYRSNINVTSNTTDRLVTFYDVTNVTYISQVNASFFFYNSANTGHYFLWVQFGQLPDPSSLNQSAYLDLSNVTGDYYRVIVNNTFGNFTLYYGNASYSYTSTNMWLGEGYVVDPYTTAGTYTWTSPAGITRVNITMAGGGGGGRSGSSAIPLYSGNGGGAASSNVCNNTVITGSTGYSVVVGAAGTGGTGGWEISGPNNGGNGGSSSFGSTLCTAAGGTGATTSVAGETPGAGSSGSFNNWGTGYIASGSSGGQGYSWYMNVSPNVTCLPGGNPNTTYNSTWCLHYTSTSSAGGGNGGNGGGGGGGTWGTGYTMESIPDIHKWLTGGGGSGSTGIVLLQYLLSYDKPAATILSSTSSRTSATTINQSSSAAYVGTVVGLATSTDGGYIGIITDNDEAAEGGMYRQAVSSTGLGSYVIGSPQYPGTPMDVKLANSASYTIEGRGSYVDVYDYGGTVKAQAVYTGTVRSVDIDVVSALLGVYGGDEGRLDLISRIGSTTWYTYYTGSVGTRVDAVALSWDGNYAVAGRLGSTIELYSTNATVVAPNVTPTITYNEAHVKVYKDSAAYTYQPVCIFVSNDNTTNESSWTPVSTIPTDSTGAMSYTTTSGLYYKFVVNCVPGTTSGEGSQIWQSNYGTTSIVIQILTPSTPYEWNAYYTDATKNVTVVYSDTVIPSSVTVNIVDLKTGSPVYTHTYVSEQNFVCEYHDALGNGTYQVTILTNRLGTNTIRDQRMVTSPELYSIAIPVDKNMKYAIFTVLIMLMGGMFTYINSKRGALAVVVVAIVCMVFDFLPMSMLTIAMIAALFAVLSLFGSRV